jgi:phenylpropionate dioxygenase-like ring-hydroxylating dioxygenase large terminal subunit
MPDSTLVDARTSPAAVWKELEHLKGEDLFAWRIADVPNRPSAEERNLTEGYPFGWYAVCYSDELEVGQVKPVRYFGREFVVWRGEDGTARVLDAYCRHLGAHMGYGGRVNGNDLECPFHAWQYDGTGAVTNIPYSRTVPPQAKRADCVRSWQVVERNGFVSVWYHPEGLPPKWEIENYPEVGSADWTPYTKSEWRVFTSMRNMHDNGVDGAHFLYIHRTAHYPDSEVTFAGNEWNAVARAKLGTPRGLVDGAIVSHNRGPGLGNVRFQGISETLLVSAITPVAPDELHVRFAFTQPKAEAEGPTGGLARALIRDIGKQLDQDKIVWDRMRYEDHPLMCEGDGPVPAARERFDRFMSDAAYDAAEGKSRTIRTKPNVA